MANIIDNVPNFQSIKLVEESTKNNGCTKMYDTLHKQQ